jgi:hypothetical protein
MSIARLIYMNKTLMYLPMKEVLECPEIKRMNLPESFTETLLESCYLYEDMFKRSFNGAEKYYMERLKRHISAIATEVDRQYYKMKRGHLSDVKIRQSMFEEPKPETT